MSLPIQLEARSVTHLQSLNKGLELKVIELQLKLVEKETERQTAEEQWNRQKCSYEEVHTQTSLAQGFFYKQNQRGKWE